MKQIDYVSGELKFWFKIIACITILMWLLKTSFNLRTTIGPISNFWDFLSYLGVYFGISGMVVAVGEPKFFDRLALVGALALGAVIYLGLWLAGSDYIQTDILSNVYSMLGLFGLVVLLSVAAQYKSNQAVFSFWLYMTLVYALMTYVTHSTLELSTIFFPNTFDQVVYKIDEAFFGARQALYDSYQHTPEWFQDFVLFIYSVLPFCLFILVSLVINERKAKDYRIIRTLLVPFGIAYMCYALVPITGPIYAFEDLSRDKMPNPDALEAVASFVAPAARNGMPSMHFTGAFLIWLLTATLRRKVYFYLACVFLLLTVVATIGLGEHYVLDLVVAMPFAVALSFALMSPKGWFKQKSMQIAWSSAVLMFAFWMIGIVAIPQWLSDHLWFVRLLSLASFVVCVYLSQAFIRMVWRFEPQPSAELTSTSAQATLVQPTSAQSASTSAQPISTQATSVQEQTHRQAYPKWAVGAFVVSGFAGLLYEVVYAKSLAITFGSTSLASYTVLVTYMGGMALGAWIGGIFADKVKKPLLYYVGIEAVIGVYAVLTPTVFKLIQALYLSFVGDLSPDAPILTTVRVALGVVALGIPTILMGATVPFMFKYLKTFGVATETAVSRLYSANVVGAALGSLVGAYVLLPMLGRIGATNLAAVISLLLALYVLEQIKKIKTHPLGAKQSEHITHAMPMVCRPVNRNIGITALVVLLVGGAITLALEVVSIHMLAVVAGNSVYAFGLMLATFLIGLSTGSMAGEKMLSFISRHYAVVIAQCGVCASIIITAFLWDKIPVYFASFGFIQQYHHLGFAAREIIRGCVCVLAMFPAAFFIGISYPAAMSLASDWLMSKSKTQIGEAKAVGIASALNTLGNISGVLIVAFYALPQFGSNRVFIALAFFAFALAVLMFVVDYQKFAHKTLGFRTASVGLLASFALFFVYPQGWNVTRLSQGANVYFTEAYWGEVIDHAESVTGGLTSVAHSGKGQLTLLTNGKFQGNNTGEIEAQESIALIPLLHTDKRGNVLVIGYGTGMSARVLHEQHFEQMDIAELAKDIVDIADKYFPENNHGVSSKPNVHMYYTDGRNYLLTQNKKYDLISLEISSIWFAGAANLYNKEFYQLAKKRLHDDGILQQWVQLHHMHPVDLIYILNTVRSQFSHVWLYVSGGQGIIVASNSPDAVNMHTLKEPYRNLSTQELKALSDDLATRKLLSPKGVNNLAQATDPTLRHIISTDNNLYLEYATPKGNVLEGMLESNIEFLSGFEKKSQ